jgi:hypothetical protein
MLRRFGQADRILITSEERLSAPSWRPDGSLVTFARETSDGVTINMLILSDPLLERILIEDTDLFIAPVAWIDRQQMLYAAILDIEDGAFPGDRGQARSTRTEDPGCSRTGSR